MLMSIYLSDEIADVLKCFGELSEVTNRILKAGSDGVIDIMHKPKIPDKKGGQYYKIIIEDPDYLELLDTFGPKSSVISIRRLLYWFVENGIYEELEWEPKETYESKSVNKNYDAIVKLKQSLHRCLQLMPQYKDDLLQIREIICKIEEELWYV